MKGKEAEEDLEVTDLKKTKDQSVDELDEEIDLMMKKKKSKKRTELVLSKDSCLDQTNEGKGRDDEEEDDGREKKKGRCLRRKSLCRESSLFFLQENLI